MCLCTEPHVSVLAPYNGIVAPVVVGLFCFISDTLLWVCLVYLSDAGDQSQVLTVAGRATPPALISCLFLINLVHLKCIIPVPPRQTLYLHSPSFEICYYCSWVHCEDTQSNRPQIIAQEMRFRLWTVCLHSQPSKPLCSLAPRICLWWKSHNFSLYGLKGLE